MRIATIASTARYVPETEITNDALRRQFPPTKID
jgi:hypothetical protein